MQHPTETDAFGGLLLVVDAVSVEAATTLRGAVDGLAHTRLDLSGELEGAVALQIEGVRIPLWTALVDTRLFVGGGVSPDDVAALRAPDAATHYDDPDLVGEAAVKIGTANLVVAIDARRIADDAVLVPSEREPGSVPRGAELAPVVRADAEVRALLDARCEADAELTAFPAKILTNDNSPSKMEFI